MLEKFIKKAAGIDAVDASLVASQAEQIAQMTELLETADQQIAQLEEVVAEHKSSLQAALEKLAVFEAAANEAAATAAAAEQQAAELKIAARKEKLADVIGSENPSFDSIFTAVESLDDAAFDVIVGGYKQQAAAEANSAMFKEVGFTVEGDSAQLEQGLGLKQLKKKKQAK